MGFETLSDQGSLQVTLYSAKTIKEIDTIQHIERKENDIILLLYRGYMINNIYHSHERKIPNKRSFRIGDFLR